MRHVVEERIPITTDEELDTLLAQLEPALNMRETEHSWEHIDAALARFQAATRGGAHKVPSYVPVVRDIAGVITTSLLSERTRLSGTASDVINSMAPRLGDGFAPLLPLFVPPLLQICARTNKVAVKRAEKSLYLICRHCRPVGIVPHLQNAIQDKAPSLRAVAAGCMVFLLADADPVRFARRIAELESCIAHAVTDASPDVRRASRDAYSKYASLWPERVSSFLESLSPTARRYLANVPAAAEPEPPRQTIRVTRVPAAREPVRRARRVPMHPEPEPELEHAHETPRRPVFDAEAFTQASKAAAQAPPEEESPAMAHIPPPPPGAAPSDGVAYRLALAREQMKAKGRSMPRTRPASMMLGARSESRPAARVVYSGIPPERRHPKTCSSFSGGPKSLLHGKAVRGNVEMAAQRASHREHMLKAPAATVSPAAPETPSKGIFTDAVSPVRCAPTPREQFTPRRRPFGILDGNQGTPHDSPNVEKRHQLSSPTRAYTLVE